MKIPSEVQFTSACFWVNAYDVSGKKQRGSFAQLLASNIGTLVSCDETTMFGVNKALCLHVDIDVSKPFRRGLHISIGGKTLWIHFKHIKLPDFCYGCGRLGHILKGLWHDRGYVGGPELAIWNMATSLSTKIQMIDERKVMLIEEGPNPSKSTSRARLPKEVYFKGEGC
ncbi:hypothetical protein Cgig2_006419 [Carnegiea gigantea]|uniref:Zinc knuckle CX2CX4HX4C domain-containing protein n=1 Tax=Carnegiea gigantea TaxID=171969 RepID=A0A9Q1GL18_9CARY|nr:hypothetical protein Cgig2_006419 [Carnegiea gigantea]